MTWLRDEEIGQRRICPGCRVSKSLVFFRARPRDPDSAHTEQCFDCTEKAAKAGPRGPALDAYGGRCAVCGESEPKLLRLAGIGRVLPGRPYKEKYAWLAQNGWPDVITLLCTGCLDPLEGARRAQASKRLERLMNDPMLPASTRAILEDKHKRE